MPQLNPIVTSTVLDQIRKAEQARVNVENTKALWIFAMLNDYHGLLDYIEDLWRLSDAEQSAAHAATIDTIIQANG